MAYKLTYQVQVAWVGAGAGPMEANTAPQLPIQTGTGQVREFSPVGGPPFSITFLAGDVTNLLTAMTTDLSTQMNANLGTIQGWATGNP